MCCYGTITRIVKFTVSITLFVVLGWFLFACEVYVLTISLFFYFFKCPTVGHSEHVYLCPCTCLRIIHPEAFCKSTFFIAIPVACV